MRIVISFLQGDRIVTSDRTRTPHPGDRAEALAELGWTGRDAEWVAPVCVHGGVFLRAGST